MKFQRSVRAQATLTAIGVALCAGSFSIQRLTLPLFIGGMGLILLSTAWIIGTASDLRYAIPNVLCVQLTLSSLYVLPRYGIYGWDSVRFFQITRKIVSDNSVATITGRLAHIYSAQLYHVTGVKLDSAVKYTPFLLIAVFALALFILNRRAFGFRAAIVGTLAVSTFWWVTEFHTWAVKESLSLPLSLFCLYFVYRYMNSRRSHHLLAAMLLYSGVVISHSYLAFITFIAMITFEVASRLSDYFTFLEPNSVISSSVSKTGILLPAGIITATIYLVSMPGRVVGLLTVFQLPKARGAQGTIPEPIYRSLYTFLRQSWWGSRWQIAAIGSVFLLLWIVVLVKRRKLKFAETSWTGIVGALGALYFLSYFTDFGLTKTRVLNLAWVFLIPLIAGLLSRMQFRRAMYGLFTILIIVNLAFQPYHVAVGDVKPAFESGEEEFGYYKTDHRAAQWAGDYTTETVYSAEGYESFIGIYGAEGSLGEPKPWIYSLSSTPAGYIYITPREREYLRVPSYTPSTDPPRWDETVVLSRVYTTGDRTVYQINQRSVSDSGEEK